jgi:hypothetical protein
MSGKVNVFLSHIAEEQVEANKAKAYLEQVYKDQIDVFLASSWTSIPPGEDWFKCIADAITKADIMVVFCSGDSVGRPWVQFETGAGWFAKNTKVIPVCHKGMTPSSLPEPIRRLQAVDINSDNEATQLQKLAQAISRCAGLPEPKPISVEDMPLAAKGGAMPSLKGWILRPGAHKGEKIHDVFKVGGIGAADFARATIAGIDPNDSIYVRLYVEPPNGQYVNAMAQGKAASFFESDDIEGTIVIARLRLAGVFQGHGEEGSATPVTPVIVIEEAKPRPK